MKPKAGDLFLLDQGYILLIKHDPERFKPSNNPYWCGLQDYGAWLVLTTLSSSTNRPTICWEQQTFIEAIATYTTQTSITQEPNNVI